MNTLQHEWNETKKLVRQGYRLLNKTVILNIPAPCLPATDDSEDTGIGSPTSRGGKRFFDFFEGIFDKVLLGPAGRTFAPKHSPYESTYGYNPFFIDLQALTTKEYGQLLSDKTLKEIYAQPKEQTDIFFPMVGRFYNTALYEAYDTFQKRLKEKNAFALQLHDRIKALKQSFVQYDAEFYTPFAQDRYLFEEALAQYMLQQVKIPTIADVEVKLPDSLVVQKPYLFLQDYTLGSPPDQFSQNARDWNFKVFNPEYLIDKHGKLGEAGQFLFDVFDRLFQTYQGGVRIDHFIGFVNPFVFAHNKEDKSGRLYSSKDNTKLAKYCKRDEQFGDLVEQTIIAAMQKNNKSVMDIFPEDLGARPEQLDDVMRQFGLGHLCVCQFAQTDNPGHMYNLSNTRPQDIGALDTHDTPSIQAFFNQMDDGTAAKHAGHMANYLRFRYTDDLKAPAQLIRMKWAELMTCPAERVQAFFTSLTGQPGRYNEPGNPKKWRLRCTNDFEHLYFKNLLQGVAYNPLDAIALAIFAKGDDFYYQHQDFVRQLRAQEDRLLSAIRKTL